MKENKKNPVGRPAKIGLKRTFYLEQDLAELFDEFCSKTARSKTKVAEIAIAEYIERHKSEME